MTNSKISQEKLQRVQTKSEGLKELMTDHVMSA